MQSHTDPHALAESPALTSGPMKTHRQNFEFRLVNRFGCLATPPLAAGCCCHCVHLQSGRTNIRNQTVVGSVWRHSPRMNVCTRVRASVRACLRLCKRLCAAPPAEGICQTVCSAS